MIHHILFGLLIFIQATLSLVWMFYKDIFGKDHKRLKQALAVVIVVFFLFSQIVNHYRLF